MNINETLDRVKNSIYGRDIRQAIIDAVNTVYADAATSGNANMEVTAARGLYNTLIDRLNASDLVIADVPNKAVKGKITGKDFDTSSDANKIKLANLATEVIQAIAGTASVNATVADGGVTSEKYAAKSIGSSKFADEATNKINFAKNRIDEIRQLKTLNALTGFRDGTKTAHYEPSTYATTPLVYTTTDDQAPYPVEIAPKIMQFGVNIPSGASGALAYSGDLITGLTPLSKVVTGIWLRKSDIAALPNFYWGPLLRFETSAGVGIGIADQALRFDKSELVLGTVKTLAATYNGETANIYGEVTHEYKDWIYVMVSTDRCFTNTGRIRFYNRINHLLPVGTAFAGKIDTLGFTALVGHTTILPFYIYPETEIEKVKTSQEIAKILSRVATTDSVIADRLTALGQTNSVNKVTGINTGTASTYSGGQKSSLTTISLVDNDGTAPFLKTDMVKKMIRWGISRSSTDTGTLAYWSHRITGLSDNSKVVYGAFLRRSAIAALPSALRFSPVAYFYPGPGTSGTFGQVNGPNIAPSDLQVVGTKVTNADSSNVGITSNVTVEVKYVDNDWIYVQTSIDKMLVGTKEMDVYWRFNSVPQPMTLVNVDVLNFTVLVNETSVLPYKVYSESDTDLTTPQKITDAINTVNTSLIKKVDRSEIIVPPLKTKSPIINAVKNRYAQTIDKSRYKSNDNLVVIKPVYNDTLWTKYGIPNTIQASDQKSASSYYPTTFVTISASDLASIGVVPDDVNPPVVSMRSHYYKPNIVNGGYLQIWFGLRYGADINVPTYNTSQDVVLRGTDGVGAYLGQGDTLWNHTTVTIDDGTLYGFVKTGIKIPATYKGQPFSGMYIEHITNPTDLTAPASFEFAMTAVIKGSTMDAYTLYNNPEDVLGVTVSNANLDQDLQDKLNLAISGSGSKRLDLSTTDKIVIVGDSYSESLYPVMGKPYIHHLSMFSEYNIESFARSGWDYQELNNSIRNGTGFHHPTLSFKDYNAKYAVLVSNTNDGYYMRFNDATRYYDNLRGLIETILALGVKPIISTEFGSGGSNEQRQLKGLKAIADRYGAMFIDLVTKSRIFDQTKYLPFWGLGHPGTRTNYLFSDEIGKRLASLPRPRQSLKLFRKRDSFVITDKQDLVYDTHKDRSKRFKEIYIGHVALSETDKYYYDQLDVKQGTQRVWSEYLKLQNKESVSFGDYAVCEVIVPSTQKSLRAFTLTLSDPTIKVYGRHMFTPPYESDIKYQGFVPTSSITGIMVGDKYTSNDPALSGQTFTVFANTLNSDGFLVMDPYKASGLGSGTLTKVSGSGPATITYSSSDSALSQDYIDQVGKPEGKWIEIPPVNGKYTVAKSDFKNFMQYDKFIFLLNKSGGFTLNDIYVDWSGDEDKVYDSGRDMPKYAAGTELLAQPLLSTSANVAQWTTTGTVTPTTGVDGVYPYGCTGFVELDGTNTIKQTISFPQDYERVRTLQVKVWSRRWVPPFNPASSWSSSPITEDSYDLAELGVDIIDNNDAIPNVNMVSLTDVVGLHWKESIFEIPVPTFLGSQTIRLSSKDKLLQVAKVSAKFLD
jgi:hypothetical protein